MLAFTVSVTPSDLFDISFEPIEKDQANNGEQREGWQKVIILSSFTILSALLVLLTYILVSEYGFSYRT